MARTITRTRSLKSAARGRTVAKPKPKAKPMPKPKAKTARKAVPGRTAKATVRAKPAPQRLRRPMKAESAAPAEGRPIPAAVPSYDQLPIRDGAPAGAAWGVFGDDDQLGTVYLLTPERVIQAANFVRSGRVFALNLPIDVPDPPLFTRGKHRHVIKHFATYILDDYLDNFYPQASSQWDALSHVK